MRRILPLLILLVAATPAEAGECVFAAFRDGGTVLINRCAECRIAELERVRLGAERPSERSVVVPARSTVQSPFRGKARTRLLRDRACRQAPQQDATTAAAPDGRTCVNLHRLRDGSVAAINGCGSCRSILLERKTAEGQAKQSSYNLAARGRLPVQARGYASARILSDSPCR